jgi:hypothetical protein
MKQYLTRVFLACGAFGLLSLAPSRALAAPVDFCLADFSECDIFEQADIFQPFGPGPFFIAGDVVLTDPTDQTVSDVFRIFNDFVDTGGGTGIGSESFLYSVDEGNLPDPSTFSVNELTLVEGSTIVPALGLPGFVETNYNGNGTLYRIFSDEEARVPEPASCQLLGIAVILMIPMMRRRLRRTRTRAALGQV